MATPLDTLHEPNPSAGFTFDSGNFALMHEVTAVITVPPISNSALCSDWEEEDDEEDNVTASEDDEDDDLVDDDDDVFERYLLGDDDVGEDDEE